MLTVNVSVFSIVLYQACQSSELDLLIPLEFFSSKLVLVGDPEQLSATVKSAVSHIKVSSYSLHVDSSTKKNI